MIEPGLDLTWWIPLLCVALCTSLATLLDQMRSSLWTFAASVAALGGLCVGFAIWPPRDPIARPYIPFAVVAMTVAAALVSLVFGRTARILAPLHGRHRTTIWIAFLCVVAFGPFALALTPHVVERRIAFNERIAADRFFALKAAVKKTYTESQDPKRVCDGLKLRQHYAGPPFSDEDWWGITSNAVKENGYFFMVYCQEKGGYTIDASPFRVEVDGTRRFCSDETGTVGCGVTWDRSRHACAPAQGGLVLAKGQGISTIPRSVLNDDLTLPCPKRKLNPVFAHPIIRNIIPFGSDYNCGPPYKRNEKRPPSVSQVR